MVKNLTYRTPPAAPPPAAIGSDGRRVRKVQGVDRRECAKWRIFASLCVTLGTEKTPNRHFSTAFWPEIGGRIAAIAKKPGGAKA
jgi:hypothetical protein